MRIAFDQQAFCWQVYGGVSRYVFELARELAVNQGQDVSVIAPFYVNRYLRDAPPALKVSGTPIDHVPLPEWLVREINSLVLGPLLVRPALRKLAPDIVHESYYGFPRLAPPQSKVVLTVHDMIHERFPESFSAYTPTRREKMAAVARADHIICISHQTQRDLVEMLQVDPSRTTVIHTGVEPGDPPPVECPAIHGRPYLLYVGNRGGYKNFAGFVRAVAGSPALQKSYRIVCFGGGGFSAEEQALLGSLGYSAGDVIHAAGSDAVLAELYRHAHVFVYPSRYEGFGIPPLEAMSFGCPVACSNVSSIPEVVGNAGACFDPDSVEDMRAVIERLAGDAAQRASLIAAGRERIKQFTWSRCAKETLEVYRKLVA